MKVACEIDDRLYNAGIKITDEQLEGITIFRNAFHGEWNYKISPLLISRTFMGARGGYPVDGIFCALPRLALHVSEIIHTFALNKKKKRI